MNIRERANYYRNLSLETEVLKSIRANEAYIVDLNTSQLMNGKDSMGKFLTPYRNPNYAALKRAIYNPRGVTDLRLSGDFHDGFFINANRFPVVFDSRDEKTELLTSKYGNDIFGLDKENLGNLASFVKKDLRRVLLPKGHPF